MRPYATLLWLVVSYGVRRCEVAVKRIVLFTRLISLVNEDVEFYQRFICRVNEWRAKRLMFLLSVDVV